MGVDFALFPFPPGNLTALENAAAPERLKLRNRDVCEGDELGDFVLEDEDSATVVEMPLDALDVDVASFERRRSRSTACCSEAPKSAPVPPAPITATRMQHPHHKRAQGEPIIDGDQQFSPPLGRVVASNCKDRAGVRNPSNGLTNHHPPGTGRIYSALSPVADQVDGSPSNGALCQDETSPIPTAA